MKEVKPALSINNQIEHLTSAHGLIIDDVEKAHVILSRINYYRLSGYGIGLKRQDDREQYRPGISIDTLFRLYQFDSLFKNNLVHLIEQIEIRLRAQISNFLALKYGPLGYLNADNFCDHATKKMDSIHQAIIDSFNNEVDRQKNLPYVKHHVQEYGGQFPIWVAVELFSFGNLSSLLSIMKHEDQLAIAKLYNTVPSHLMSWLLALVEIRNICAHYNRLYNLPLKQKPYLYKENRQYIKGKQIKVFPAVITLKRMLSGTDEWDVFYGRLVSDLAKYSDVVQLPFIGFPDDWKAVLA